MTSRLTPGYQVCLGLAVRKQYFQDLADFEIVDLFFRPEDGNGAKLEGTIELKIRTQIIL